MNKHILIAMDWKNRSLEELRKNRDDAYAYAKSARDHALDDYRVANTTAAYSAAYSAYSAAAAYSTAAAYSAAAAYSTAAAYSAYSAAAYYAAEHWVNKYFEETGEDREDYEKALEGMK